MDIVIAAVGRLKAGPERELCDRYLDRSRKSGAKLGLRGFSVSDITESRGARPAGRIAEEAKALAGLLRKDDRVICLIADGTLADSEAFARSLSADAAFNVPRTVFIIGGPDGLGATIVARADRKLSFGRLTLPHQLVRVLLAEQLYRAATILSGHPYHRA